jgi:glutathione S-transferase
MSDELVFYTNPMSRGRIVRWMLEEVGRPYRTELVPFGPAMKSPEYRAINPMGKVPAIRHGEVMVTECAAICAYLADAFPEAGLAPAPGARERGPYYRWMFFAAGPLEAAVTNKTLAVEVPPERRGMVGYGSFADVMDALEAAVSKSDYVAGDRFTAADVYVGAHVVWGLEFGSIEKRPAFERYARRLATRPAAARAKEMDDALMPNQPAPASPAQR